MKKDHEEKIVKIADIQLDQENPRFSPVGSQREAIEVMLKDQGEKVFNLAADIYQHGVNPSTKLILFKEKGKYIDGDGNRRLTALKILETPSLSDSSPNIRKKFDTILKRPGVVPNEVSCVVFASRNAARHWIAINHGGEQEGRGQINWNAEQKDRFERKPSIGLEALDILTQRGLITNEDKSRVNKSTLDRLLSFKDTKTQLAISKKGDHFVFGDIERLKIVILNLRNKTVDEVYTADKGKIFIDTAIASQSYDQQPAAPHAVVNPKSDIESTDAQGNRSRRSKPQAPPVFGGKLSLRFGHVNNLYRDVESLYGFYSSGKNYLSENFIVIFRMSLRLLAETAANDLDKDLGDYLKEQFEQAKRGLGKNERTTLSNQNVTKESVTKLLQTGAHDYNNSRNEEQALALSIILGAILHATHGKTS